jgi:DedD protein
MMERALKERIIGAVILVVIVVSVVPIFLDGPPEEGEVISKRVLLPGQDGQESKTVVLNRERTEPIPVANESQAETRPVDNEEVAAPTEAAPLVVEQPSAPVKPPPQPETKPETEKSPPASASVPTQSAASTTGMWAVQLGSFSSKENAEKLAADLRKQGYAAFLSQLQTNSGQLHRVRIGPQKDRESAEAMAARLLKVGHKGQVLPHP